MSPVALDDLAVQPASKRPTIAPIIGTLCSVSADGVPSVDFPGNVGGAIPARVAAHIDRNQMRPGSSVVVLFEQDDPQRPVILASVADRLVDSVRTEPVSERPGEAIVDGRRVVLDAEREIILRCGKGSISLRADGKIVIKGTELVSRSSGANKIRGASVNIN